MHGACAEQSDDQGADQRALHRTHSADRHHRESQHDNLDPEARRHRYLGSSQCAAERTKHRADQKGHRIDPGHIDAERGGGFAIVDHGRQQPPEGRLLDGVGSCDRQQTRKSHQTDVVDG